MPVAATCIAQDQMDDEGTAAVWERISHKPLWADELLHYAGLRPELNEKRGRNGNASRSSRDSTPQLGGGGKAPAGGGRQLRQRMHPAEDAEAHCQTIEGPDGAGVHF